MNPLNYFYAPTSITVRYQYGDEWIESSGTGISSWLKSSIETPSSSEAPESADYSGDRDLADTFNRLAAKWREETRYISSITEIVTNPAYQRIIGLGKSVLPLIISELQERNGHWFWALEAITGRDPVKRKDWGDMDAMREAWLKWARENLFRDADVSYPRIPEAISYQSQSHEPGRYPI